MAQKQLDAAIEAYERSNIEDYTDKTKEALKKAQSEISRLEGRSDYRLSTLQRYVAALGGELEVVASFGNRRVRLRAA